MRRRTIACRLAQKAEPTPGRTPRVARLLALAHRFQGLIDAGVVADYAELARLGHVSRARVSHILSLLNLAPDLQETILFLPPTRRGRDPITLVDLLAIARLFAWQDQRRCWNARLRQRPHRARK